MKLDRTTNIYLIYLVWLLVQSILFYTHGIVTAGEAEKYIGEANTLLQSGTLSVPNYWFYFTQISLLAIAFKTGLGYAFVFIIQLLFSAWATRCFYLLINQLLSPQAALVGTLLLLINYPYQEFNMYMQTESLFHSFTIIYTTYLLRLTKLTWRTCIAIVVTTVLICITRPTGLLLVPAIGLYLFFRFVKGIPTRLKVIIVTAAAVAFLFVLNAAMGSSGEWDFMVTYFKEHIICGMPTITNNGNTTPAPGGDSVYGLLTYIVNNFGQFIRLALLRSKAFFGLQRSYYSIGHNIYLALFFYCLYASALLSSKWWTSKQAYTFLYLISAIAMTWLTTCFTCDDWHNRWLLSVSPWIILLGLPAITRLLAYLTPYGLKRNIS